MTEAPDPRESLHAEPRPTGSRAGRGSGAGREPHEDWDRNGSGNGRTVDRRRFLQGVATGGAIALSGCSEFGGSDDPELTVDADGRAWVASFDGRLDDRQLGQPSGLLAAFAHDVPFALDPVSREHSPVLAEEYEETGSSVSITLRSGLAWSNGDPLTAADVGRWVTMLRAGASWLAPVPDVRSGERRPRSAWEAITDVEWDDATVTVRGRFETVPTPLYELNAQVGRRPRTYYGELWDEFVDAFGKRPWEDEVPRKRITSLVGNHLWTVGQERLPPAGISLEESSDGDDWTAAYSGLWYPYRTNENHLHFAINEEHPFADRMSYDEVIWAFRDEPDARVYDLRSGAVDGAMLDRVSDHVIESAPQSVTSFDGPASGGVALRFNHSTHHLANRDVRAALAHAVDREAVAKATISATDEPVSVPGGDLLHDRWAPPELREELRSYRHDPDRARNLLERAGFSRAGGEWRTPDDDPFEFEVLTDAEEPTAEITVAEQLRSFGIDASIQRIERTSYQSRLQTGQFVATTSAWSSPNAAGLPWTRAGGYIRSILRDGDLAETAFLAAAVADAIADRDDLYWTEGRTDESGNARRLAFGSLDSLRAITVEAPPFGEPDGDLREWPYLYHAVRANATADASEPIEHAKRCAWVYNYQLPQLELTVDVPRIFHDTADWSVPSADDESWRYVHHRNQPGGLWAALGWGHVDSE